MPSYNSTPFAKTFGLLPGTPGLAFGTGDVYAPNSKGIITGNVLASNVLTLDITLQGGSIPKVGQLVTAVGQANASGAFNVTQLAITTVTGFSTGDNSVGTVKVALTHADVGQAADNGLFVIQPVLVGETLANGKSQAFAVSHTEGILNQAKTVVVDVSFPSIPTAATVDLQGALYNSEADFVTIAGTTITVAASAQDKRSVEVANVNYNFYRLIVAGVTGGTSPTIIASIKV